MALAAVDTGLAAAPFASTPASAGFPVGSSVVASFASSAISATSTVILSTTSVPFGWAAPSAMMVRFNKTGTSETTPQHNTCQRLASPSGSVVSSSNEPVPSTNSSYVDFSGNGRLPSNSIISSRLRISFLSNRSATFSTSARCFVSSSFVRTYARSISARTSSSMIWAVCSEYGLLNIGSPGCELSKLTLPTFLFMPKRVICAYALSVIFFRSSCAPVVMRAKKSSSDTRPPSVMHIRSYSCSVVRRGSECSRNQPDTAWPASWYATVRFSSGDSTFVFFSIPAITRSIACSKCFITIDSLRSRAAIRAASLHTFAMSAPVNPGVRAAILRAKSVLSRSVLSGPKCTLKIEARPLMSGAGTKICRSKRPGRRSALSRMSTRFVAASTTTFVVVLNPSISTSSWFSVFSCSEWPPKLLPPRFRPTASISSMNNMHGAFLRAIANMSRTRDGPTPTNISRNSDPDTVMNGTFASPAVALASSVLPVPGGPVSMAPLGIFAPRSMYCWGFFRKLTNSMISILASSQPATSLRKCNRYYIYRPLVTYHHTTYLKPTLISFALISLAVDCITPPNRPPPRRPPRPPPIISDERRIMYTRKPMISSVGSSPVRLDASNSLRLSTMPRAR
uniref:Uncharacterized protein n=1 Tax=Anopheles dirus TaxID=7168 RepID=A0A182N998_9DIPT